MEWAWKNQIQFVKKCSKIYWKMSGQVTGNPYISLKIFKIMYGCILFNISLTLHLINLGIL